MPFGTDHLASPSFCMCGAYNKPSQDVAGRFFIKQMRKRNNESEGYTRFLHCRAAQPCGHPCHPVAFCRDHAGEPPGGQSSHLAADVSKCLPRSHRPGFQAATFQSRHAHHSRYNRNPTLECPWFTKPTLECLLWFRNPRLSACSGSRNPP